MAKVKVMGMAKVKVKVICPEAWIEETLPVGGKVGMTRPGTG